jgi:3-phosphoshikimate 1-carboxyvinyltransferase
MSLDWIASPGRALHGEVRVPGDKSISHRALMLAAIADGTSRISGFLEGEDTRATAAILQQLGVRIETPVDGVRIVHGVGMHGLRGSNVALDCGNAGTGMRLLCGLLAGQAFDSVLVGDASLSRRPMARVIEPLTRMGARITASDGGCAPIRINSNNNLQSIDIKTHIASAQLKSAILLAGLYADGTSTVREPHPTRDYTERMLAAFGYPIVFSPGIATVQGGHRLRAIDITVPADFSSAAFFIVAASVVPGSELRLRAVGMSPRRTGLLKVLRAMGADIIEEACVQQDIATADAREHGEPLADLRVRSAPLHGIDIAPELVPDMIDEFPILFVAAALADGITTIRGAAELRVKESDRIAGMTTGLRALGVAIDETPDGAVIHGIGATGKLRAGTVDSHGDHRIAMSFAIAAQRADDDVRIADCANVATSFPGFADLATGLGIRLRVA